MLKIVQRQTPSASCAVRGATRAGTRIVAPVSSVDAPFRLPNSVSLGVVPGVALRWLWRQRGGRVTADGQSLAGAYDARSS
jgi:hypothetical protein